MRPDHKDRNIDGAEQFIGYRAESQLAQLAAAVGSHDEARRTRGLKFVGYNFSGEAVLEEDVAGDALLFDLPGHSLHLQPDLLVDYCLVRVGSISGRYRKRVCRKNSVDEHHPRAAGFRLRDRMWHEIVAVGQIG